MQPVTTEKDIRNPIVFGLEISKFISQEPKTIKWTKQEYHYLAELGLFEGRRTEFLEGEIIEMPTMNSPHATALELTQEVLRDAFTRDFAVRNQSPIDFGDEFEAVPDITVVRGTARDFKDAHPQRADLLIEISDTTLSYDRNRKASLYAKFGISDYWILNLKNRTLEVYRSPIEDENAYYGFAFSEKVTFKENDEVSPIAKPDVKIAVSDLLP